MKNERGNDSRIIEAEGNCGEAARFPPPRKKGQRGASKKYGDRIDMKTMVEDKKGWTIVECRQYGQTVQKKVKCFVATSKLTKGKPIKVVLIKENEKVWVPLMSTNTDQSAKDILESYGVRFGIEEVFKDLKDIWGWGKQELRLLESNEAATAILFGQCPEGDTVESLRLLVEQPPELGYSYPCNACWRYWALCRLGRSDVVLKEFRNRWATMDSVILNNTLAEDWAAQPDSGSQWSHCAVSPLFVLYSDIAGIRATAPGFTACEIRPQLADFGDLRLTYFTPQGPIRFDAKKKIEGGHKILVHVPKTCNAKLILREGDEGTIQHE